MSMNQSRRSFLAKTAAIAGVAAVVGPAKVSFASIMRERTPKAKPRVELKAGDTIKIGVIGPGGMGTGHCEAFASLAKQGREKVEVVAVADVNDLHAARGARKVKEAGQTADVATYRDYRELLKRDDLHGVLIASPEHWHSQHAIDAMLAGKDVYCEKPMTLRLEEAMKMRAVQFANPDVLLQVGTQMMQLPKWKEAKRLLAAGAIGKPTMSQTSYCRNTPDGEWNYYGIDPNWRPGVNLDWEAWCGPMGRQEWDPKVYIRWRRYRKYSTGILGDLLVHEMTPLCWALDMGWPTRVIASGGHYVDKDMENHDTVNLTIQFERQHTMIVAGATNNENGLERLIRGQKANMFMGSNNVVIRPESKFVDEVEQQTVQCPDIGNDQDVHRLHWLHCIRTREIPAADVEMGTKIMVIVDLATRSMWDGHAWQFDPYAMTAERI